MRFGLILKKEKNLLASDSDEFGDIYTLTAMKTDTRLFLSHHEGGRTTEDAIALFRDVSKEGQFILPSLFSQWQKGLRTMFGILER